jgi:hypothetical protein
MNTSKLVVGLVHPLALVAKTEIALGINPGAVNDQSTIIELVPCPETKAPNGFTVQVYVYPGVFGI